MQDGKNTTNTTLADVMNLNWGGAGYASYEGRLEDTGSAGTSTAAPTTESVMDGIFSRQPEGSESAPADAQDAGQEGGEAVDEGTDADWQETSADGQADEEFQLPSEDEVDFTDDVYKRYAKKHNIDESLIENPSVRNLLKAQIQNDRYLAQQEQERDDFAQEEELLGEDEQEEEAPQPLVQGSPEWQAQRKAYFDTLDRMAAEVTSPDMAEAFGVALMKAWGIEKPTKADMARVAPLAQTYTKFGINLMATALPKLLPGLMNNAVPGLSKAMERLECADAWDNLRDSTPEFAEMPDFGTHEFRQMMNQVLNKHPYLEYAVFRDPRTGRPLDSSRNTLAKYKAVAQIAAGRQLNPRIVQQAVQTGKAIANRANQTRANGKLGGGQSKGAFQKPQPKSFMQEVREAYEKDTNPVVFSDGTRS